MKRRFLEAHDGVEPELALCKAVLALRNVGEARAFLRDLCTPAELEALTDRWRVVAPLWRGVPYRDVHEASAVSVTTIGRVARFLSQGNGGYSLVAERLYGPRPSGDRQAKPVPVQRNARSRNGTRASRTPRRVAP